MGMGASYYAPVGIRLDPQYRCASIAQRSERSSSRENFLEYDVRFHTNAKLYDVSSFLYALLNILLTMCTQSSLVFISKL